MIKILILIALISLIFIACKDTNSPVSTPDDIDNSQNYFPLVKENYWEYKNSQNDKLIVEINKLDSVLWARNFIDTENKVKYFTHNFKFKKFSTGSNMGKTTNFAFAETDSFLLFGSNINPLIKEFDSYPADFFITIFKLPNILVESSKTVFPDSNNHNIYENLTVKSIYKSHIDSVPSKWSVSYIGVNRTANKWVLQFEITEKQGFSKIDDYILTLVDLEE